jgi:hypothetical protein
LIQSVVRHSLHSFFLLDGGNLEALFADNGTDMRISSPSYEFHSSGFSIIEQNEMDKNNLIIRCTLHDQEKVIKSHTLIDCSTTCYAFIDKKYAHLYYLSL